MYKIGDEVHLIPKYPHPCDYCQTKLTEFSILIKENREVCAVQYYCGQCQEMKTLGSNDNS